MIATGIIAKSQTALTEKEVTSYSRAGAIAEEVLSSVRTVVAFGGEKKEVERYESNLIFARKANIFRGLLTGVGGGLMWLIIYASYALAFWYGVKLIMDDREQCYETLFQDCPRRYDPSTLLIVFFSVLMGAMNVGQATPYVEAFSIARGAAGMVYEIIERVPEIDSMSKEGKMPKERGGNITFKDVYFNYPSRNDVKVHKKFIFLRFESMVTSGFHFLADSPRSEPSNPEGGNRGLGRPLWLWQVHGDPAGPTVL